MPITKTQIINTIKAMPQEEFTNIDEVFEEIILMEKIEKGLAAMNNGDVVSEEEANKIMDSWLK